MSDSCCNDACAAGRSAVSPRFRRALWIALIVNLTMFVAELAGGLKADSVSLLADAADFLGDAASYGVSLLVLAFAPIWGSRAALLKGWTMAAFGVFVLGRTVWGAGEGTTPEPMMMGAIGLLALLTNIGVAALFYAFREGDANMRSVWLCSRNDAIGNLAVILAALGVFGSGSAWPDLAVAAVMAFLALTGAISVIGQARFELRQENIHVAHP